ncbi:hypothetical protein D3C81_1306500 [compost metagenome]
MPCAFTHVVLVCALLGIQRPDHAIKGPPAGQAAIALDHHIVQLVLHTAAPEQHGALVFQPVVPGQAGRDGLDLLGFADDEQESDLGMPKTAVARAQRSSNPGFPLSVLGASRICRRPLRRLGLIVRLKWLISSTANPPAYQLVPTQEHHQHEGGHRADRKPERLPGTTRCHAQ